MKNDKTIITRTILNSRSGEETKEVGIFDSENSMHATTHFKPINQNEEEHLEVTWNIKFEQYYEDVSHWDEIKEFLRRILC